LCSPAKRTNLQKKRRERIQMGGVRGVPTVCFCREKNYQRERGRGANQTGSCEQAKKGFPPPQIIPLVREWSGTGRPAREKKLSVLRGKVRVKRKDRKRAGRLPQGGAAFHKKKRKKKRRGTLVGPRRMVMERSGGARRKKNLVLEGGERATLAWRGGKGIFPFWEKARFSQHRTNKEEGGNCSWGEKPALLEKADF